MRFKHDCDKCRPLGEWFEYDLYFHPSERRGLRTIIARMSDEPSDYVSGLELVRHFPAHFPALKEAKRLAIEGGLLEADPPHRMERQE